MTCSSKMTKVQKIIGGVPRGRITLGKGVAAVGRKIPDVGPLRSERHKRFVDREKVVPIVR